MAQLDVAAGGVLLRGRRAGWRRISAPAAPPAQIGVLLTGALAGIALGAAIARTEGAKTASLYGVGVALGVVLFHARFGFTSAWRQFVAVGQGKAVRAHMLMLAVACVLFAPILATHRGVGNVDPVGISLVVGAFLFGAGMQLGGACASGSLYSVGSGQTAIVLTLGGFVGGSLLAVWQFAFWTRTLPRGTPVSLTEGGLGYGGALAVSLALMAAIAGLTLVIARRRRPPDTAAPPVARGVARALRGAWPLWVGAIALAVLNAVTLLVSRHPWGITSAFALWGSKIAQSLGVHVSQWAYWTAPDRAPSLRASILADRTSVMDFGIMIGALVASASAGAFVLHRRVPLRTAVAAVIGGLLMGYGARLAYGCNIGSYFSGVASFSLHGWIWGVLALGGTWVGIRLRPLFGLLTPRATDSVC